MTLRSLFAGLLLLTTRWTGWLLLWPRRFAEATYERPDEPWHPRSKFDWETFNLTTWSRRYEWEPDPWGGWLDHAQPVNETIRREAGDCVDYATLVMSHRLHTTDHTLYLALHVGRTPWHVTLYDADEGKLYSSGTTHQMDPDTYSAQNNYRWTFTRKV